LLRGCRGPEHRQETKASATFASAAMVHLNTSSSILGGKLVPPLRGKKGRARETENEKPLKDESRENVGVMWLKYEEKKKPTPKGLHSLRRRCRQMISSSDTRLKKHKKTAKSTCVELA